MISRIISRSIAALIFIAMYAGMRYALGFEMAMFVALAIIWVNTIVIEVKQEGGGK